MGLFDFVKNAGKKLLGADDEPAEAPSVAAGPSPEQVQALADRRLAAGIVKHIEALELPVTDLSVRVKGHVATVSGKSQSQEDREKVVLAVGNVNGVGVVDDQIEVEKDEPEATFYTVQSGDTLGKIAKEHYGNAMKYPVIFEANKPMLSDPDKIYPGQVLRIPPLEG